MSARSAAEAIARYTPLLPAEHWIVLAPLVRDAVTTAGCGSVGTARQYLSVVSGFVHWVWQTTGTELEPARVFHPALVARYLNEPLQTHSMTYQRTAARRLSILVANYSDAPVPSPRFGEPHASRPYTRSELIEFLSSAARRSNPERRRNTHLLLGLGAGAGLRTAEIAAAHYSDITDHGSHLTVNVRGKQARTVVVHHVWARCVRTGLDSRTGEEFAFKGYRIPGYPARVIHQLGIDDPTEATPTASRLRATWLVGHLNAGVPINLLLQQAGLADPVSLRSLINAMAPRRPEDHLELLTGKVGRS